MSVPLNMKLGCLLGMLGGIISVAAMAFAWGGTTDDMYMVGINLLMMVMFFAAAGTMTSQTPVNSNGVVVVSAIALGVVFLAMLYGSVSLLVGIILAILAIGCIAFGACPGTSRWVDSNRVTKDQ